MAGGSLDDLCTSLAITIVGRHSAFGDANATGTAATVLLRRAADESPSRTLIDAARHATLLDPAPTPAAAEVWVEQTRECVGLRCPYLQDAVNSAGAAPGELLELLEPELDAAAASAAADPNCAPGAATLLGAITPLLAELPGRRAALAWRKRWVSRLDALPACVRIDRCPSCARRQPCPVDVWRHPLESAALGPLDANGGQPAKTFLRTSGEGAGGGVYTTWRSQGLDDLADHAAWLVHQHWTMVGQKARADLVARYAWRAGGRDPRLVAAYARRLAAPGGEAALTDARSICDQALSDRGPAPAPTDSTTINTTARTSSRTTSRDTTAVLAVAPSTGPRTSTDDGWEALRHLRARLDGQLSRRRPRPTGDVDAGGNPVLVRRHHPDRPERHRPRRFASS